MTTTPVVSVTDELITELEQLYIAGWEASGEGWNAEYPGDAHEQNRFIERMRDACTPVAEKLLSERAKLKRDAERYRWIKDCEAEQIDIVIENPGDNLDAAIDAAMKS